MKISLISEGNKMFFIFPSLTQCYDDKKRRKASEQEEEPFS